MQCSVSEFCRQEGISQPSFFQWRKRLAPERPDGRGPAAPRGAAFIPVQVLGHDGVQSRSGRAGPPSPNDGGRFEIALGEFCCRLPLDVAESTLRQLVRVLSEAAGRC
jgi:hypothetical protein